MDVVFGRLHRMDFKTTLRNVNTVQSINELDGKDGTCVFSGDEHIDAVINGGNTAYIPFTELPDDRLNGEGLHIYFDLENYPFFKKAKEVMVQNPKGVFRFRRMLKSGRHNDVITGDLFVISGIFGDPKDVRVHQSDPSMSPYHVIVTVNFGGGTMAHMEYTSARDERIELEWSGIKSIIEFDSEEMTPVAPRHHTSLPLTFTVDSIIENAHKADEALAERIKQIDNLIKGGAGQ